ncbi:MAG: DEAD/DEAH box helicase [Clostridia bacterium]
MATKRSYLIKTFDEINMREETKRALVEMDISTPTEVQALVLPEMLAGKDCLVQSPTGTGKTFAFGIPILEKIDLEEREIQAVIVSPTRELAMQTTQALKNLSRFIENLRITCVVGGQSFDKQLTSLKRKPQIVVGTPGRMLDLMERKALRIKNANLLVLDEADEMLKMGFRDEINKIVEKMPETTQKAFFSATMPREIAKLSENYQKDPVNIKATISGNDMPNIKQYSLKVGGKKKVDALKYILEENKYTYVLIFCNTKLMVDNLQDRLKNDGYNALGLHGDMLQRHRTRVMASFRNKEINILVATDVAARGIDVDNIEAIINYDIPQQAEYYVHRIGRTARAKRSGVAYTFVSGRDILSIRDIEREAGVKMEELVIENITDSHLGASSNDGTTTRLFFNVGTKDNTTRTKILDLFATRCNIMESQVKEIKLLEMFSFVEADNDVIDKIKTLCGLEFCSRKLNIEDAGKSAKRGGPRSSSGYGSNRGGQRTERNGFRSESGGYRSDRNDSRGERSFKPREERSFAPRSDRGERSSRPRSESGERSFAPREERSFAPREERSFAPREERSFAPREERSSRPRSESGDRNFRSDRSERSYSPRSDSGERSSRPRSDSGERSFSPRSDSGERSSRPRSDSGERSFRPRSESGERNFRSDRSDSNSYRGEKTFSPNGESSEKSTFSRDKDTDRGARQFTPRGDSNRKSFNSNRSKPSRND